MILVLTHGRYDEYGIEKIIDVDDGVANDLIVEYINLENESMRLSNELRTLVMQIKECEKTLDGMRKPNKIGEMEGRLKNLRAQRDGLQETARTNYRARSELSTRLREAGKPVDETAVQILHLE